MTSMQNLAVVLIMAAAVGLGYTTTAGAAPNFCGTVVTNTVLHEDCIGPLIVGADNIHVNLGGHNVTCGDNLVVDGVVLQGRTGVRVSHGVVAQCRDGVSISGGGGNKIDNLDAVNNNRDGIFLLNTNNNDIRSTNTNNNDGVGIFMQNSDGNIVDGQASDLNAAVSNLLSAGVWLRLGSDNNTIRSLSIDSNGEFGVNIDQTSHGNILQSSTINNTFQVLIGNQTGVAVFGDNNLIKSNKVNDNQVGIRLFPGATGNTVMSNEAFGNIMFDLEDDNLNCDLNVWVSNRFRTANQACIN
jgi:parallel beta-helix repeat protein